MNEEIKNENMDLIEVESQDMEDTIVESEESGGILGKLVLGGVLLAAAGGGLAFLRKKNKNKIEERRIKQLEKAGYVVITPEPVEPNDEDEDVVEVVEEVVEETKG